MIIGALTAIADLLLALLILVRGRRGLGSFFLGLTTLLLSLWVLIYTVIFPYTQDQLWGKISNGVGVFLVYAAALFVYFFTKSRPSTLMERILILSSGLGALLLFLISPTDLVVVKQLTNIYQVEHGAGYPVLLGYIIAHLAYAAAGLFGAYNKARGLLRLQIQYILLASIIAPFLVLTSISFLPVLGFYQLKAFGPIFTVFFFAFVSYAILRYRLIDIRVVLQRALVYFALAVSSPFIYLFILQTLRKTPVGEFGILAPLVALITLATLFLSAIQLTRLFQDLTERLFFRGSYLYAETLGKISKILKTATSVDAFCAQLTQALARSFNAERAVFILRDDKRKVFLPIKIVGRGEYESLKLSPNDAFVKFSIQKSEVFLKDELAQERGALARKALQKLEDLGIELCIPIKVRGTLEGVLCLGPKLSGNPYTIRDINLLGIVASEAGVALENAKLYSSLEEKVKERTRALEESQKKEIERLEEITRLKDEFAFVASHELRTPVTVIEGFLQLVLDNAQVFASLPSDVRENLGYVGEAAGNLKSLINDLLDVSKLEAGKINLEIKKLRLKDTVGEVRGFLSEMSQEKKVEVSVEVGEEVVVLADPGKLREVLINLFSNAIKYNREGGRVEVRVEKRQNGEVISISDTGIGLHKEELSHLFEKFWRSDDVSQIGGTGLGLWITKKLVEKMEGKIWAESEKGKGSTFYFTLPLA